MELKLRTEFDCVRLSSLTKRLNVYTCNTATSAGYYSRRLVCHKGRRSYSQSSGDSSYRKIHTNSGVNRLSSDRSNKNRFAMVQCKDSPWSKPAYSYPSSRDTSNLAFHVRPIWPIWPRKGCQLGQKVNISLKHLKRKSRWDARSKLFCPILDNRTTWGFVSFFNNYSPTAT